MKQKNTGERWGLLFIFIHWMTAASVFGLFAMGLWMVDLNYYHDWFNRAPRLHQSIGLLILFLTLARVALRIMKKKPQALASHSSIERFSAGAIHILLYVILLSVMLSGYLISTADGSPIEFFNLFKIPAMIHGIDKQTDIAGIVHLSLAIALISLVGVHALAAVKHHFADRDRTLRRMLGL